ncbi:hypothetical protein pb186bvf_008640 [Paramecium bursaria]
MFQDYYHEIDEVDKPDQSLKYVLNHLKHAVILYQFDFDHIWQSSQVIIKTSQKKLNVIDLQELWFAYHIHRSDQQQQVPRQIRQTQDIFKDVPKQFNVLKEQIRNKDKDKIIQQLSGFNQDEQFADCPLKFKVEFDKDGNFTISESVLYQADIDNILSQPIGEQSSSVSIASQDDYDSEEEDDFEAQRARIKQLK